MSVVTPSAIDNQARLWSNRLKTALVIAHPGHELRLYDWLHASRPDVHILTNGSRASTTRARREASAALISSSGGALRDVWQGVLDTELYACIIEQRHGPFLDWTQRLADDLVQREIDLVVTDAWQYYNIAHDLTHLMARVAAAEASARLGRKIDVLDCQVAPAALAPTAPNVPLYCAKRLSAAEAEAKRAASHLYPGVEIEVSDIETHEAELAYTLERLFEPAPIALLRAPPTAKPAYEVYGEARVASGLYKSVLRWSNAATLIDTLCERYDLAADHAALEGAA
jgi:hypothetical protein